MKIIPVLDILNGITVHAVRGKRNDYKPVNSILCSSSHPPDLAGEFEKLGFRELYVADLDAILGINCSNLGVKQIAKKSRLRLTVDAGISDLDKARKTFESGASKIVIGTETLSNVAFVGEALRSFGKERVVLSLDLVNGTLIGNFLHEGSIDAMSFLNIFVDMGLTQVIVLDLARVGSGEGVDRDFLKRLINRFDMKIFVGGGVRNLEDLLDLRKLGLEGVLLASALHSGDISVENLINAGLEI